MRLLIKKIKHFPRIYLTSLVYDVYLHNSYNFCMVYYEKTKARTMTSLHPGLDKVGCQVSVKCRNKGPPAPWTVPSPGTGQNSPFRRLHGAHATVPVRGRFRERDLWTFLLYQMSYLAQLPHLKQCQIITFKTLAWYTSTICHSFLKECMGDIHLR